MRHLSMQIIFFEDLLCDKSLTARGGEKTPGHDRVDCVAGNFRRARSEMRSPYFNAEGFEFICKRRHEVYFIPKCSITFDSSEACECRSLRHVLPHPQPFPRRG